MNVYHEDDVIKNKHETSRFAEQQRQTEKFRDGFGERGT